MGQYLLLHLLELLCIYSNYLKLSPRRGSLHIGGSIYTKILSCHLFSFSFFFFISFHFCFACFLLLIFIDLIQLNYYFLIIDFLFYFPVSLFKTASFILSHFS